MKICLSDSPTAAGEAFVIDSLWKHNATVTPVAIRPLFLTLRNKGNHILAGLVARNWWSGLGIQYFWLSNATRGQRVGRSLMQSAEQEAKRRDCHIAYVTTFNFQVKEFYEKPGYSAYGEPAGYAHKHTRHYLAKNI